MPKNKVASFYPSIVAVTGIDGANSATSMVIDADNDRVAYKYIPTTTSPISGVAAYWDVTGDLSTTNFIIQIETDNNDAPSGTVLGGTNCKTNAFAGLAADGWTGKKDFIATSGDLTVGTPVWIVFYRSSGDSMSGSHAIQFVRATNTASSSFSLLQKYKLSTDAGSTWTGATEVTCAVPIVTYHADGNYRCGTATSGTGGSSGYTDIYNDGTEHRQGLKFKTGAQVKIVGVHLTVTCDGTPTALTCSVYEGSTLKDSGTIAASSASGDRVIWLASPVMLAADTDCYVIFSQANGNDANDYDLQCVKIDNTYITAVLPTNWRFVYGSGTNPTAYTVVTDRIPVLRLMILDLETDLDQAAGGGGGGLPILGGSVVR